MTCLMPLGRGSGVERRRESGGSYWLARSASTSFREGIEGIAPLVWIAREAVAEANFMLSWKDFPSARPTAKAAAVDALGRRKVVRNRECERVSTGVEGDEEREKERERKRKRDDDDMVTYQ